MSDVNEVRSHHTDHHTLTINCQLSDKKCLLVVPLTSLFSAAAVAVAGCWLLAAGGLGVAAAAGNYRLLSTTREIDTASRAIVEVNEDGGMLVLPRVRPRALLACRWRLRRAKRTLRLREEVRGHVRVWLIRHE